MISTENFANGVRSITTAADVTLTNSCPFILAWDPTGDARVLMLPPASAGRLIMVINRADAAETITVKKPSTEATLETIEQDRTAIFAVDETTGDWVFVTKFASLLT